MILKIKTGSDGWTYFDDVSIVKTNKSYAQEGCDNKTAEREEAEWPTVVNTGVGNHIVAVYMTRGSEKSKALISTEAYLTNDRGQTIERLN